MSDIENTQTENAEVNLGDLVQIRKDKLSELRADGNDPYGRYKE